MVLAITMISEYRNTVFGSCYEALNNCLFTSTDLHSTKSSDRTDSASGSGSFILPITCPVYSILMGGSIVDNLMGKSGAK